MRALIGRVLLWFIDPMSEKQDLAERPVPQGSLEPPRNFAAQTPAQQSGPRQARHLSQVGEGQSR